jgi:hypothetical protein
LESLEEAVCWFLGSDRKIAPKERPGFLCFQVFGRNGWYCLEADAERLPSLAGWRGLRNVTAKNLFNATLYVFSLDWGPNLEIMRFLQLQYTVVELGVLAAEAFIESRLSAGLPTLFYLWTPHILLTKYKLNRIYLPEFSWQAFSEGKSDYPMEVQRSYVCVTDRPCIVG